MQGSLRYDHYRVLGIPRDATAREIKQAYRERVKHCHPDRNPSPQAATLFHAVHQAYEVLHDPEQRRGYDERLLHYRPVAGPPPATARNGERRAPAEKDLPVNRFAFVGLHMTGLCFGVVLVMGILIGITFFSWPPYTVVLCLPGLAVIPDSIAGIRIK